MKRVSGFIILILLGFLAVGCATQVNRVDSRTVTDLSGRWNDTDSKEVAAEMIEDSLKRPWISNFLKDNNNTPPTILVGTIRNKSSEHISTDTFIKDIERAFINSGEIDVVAGGSQRAELRAELEDQQSFASEASRKALAQSTGTDFLLQGVVNSITDSKKGTTSIFYQVDLELTNVETNRKVWIGSKEIKKVIKRSKSSW